MHDPTITPTAAPALQAKPPARWPLILLALPAGVATWSGWVGLGERTGFGVVKPLPGLLDTFEINTAITLPIGVETYAAYALGAWLNRSPRISASTRRFAKWSAIGSLLLGMLGQVAYHLLEQAGIQHAPWQVTTVVSALPVLVLGMGAGLSHMIARDLHAPDEVHAPEPVPEPAAEPEPDPAAEQAVAELIAWTHRVGDGLPPIPAGVEVRAPEGAPEMDPLCTSAGQHYRVMLAAGKVPSVRQLKKELRIGQDKAKQVHAHLTALADTRTLPLEVAS
ncbi:hypothetical protein ACFFV7_50855 [Nonomuraea spiralis]|uniref:DUF2637 domain-containing protein n=1 Tax=Nonomuraea spiralis TaxID=46182 RepID=A0ABV5IYL6_9ACTN|nr:hypothetical protein [Nonomuraea spiralis]GGS88650.1 hypothetical protein GCM10010176_035550 [Nonomuraea spiralis]